MLYLKNKIFKKNIYERKKINHKNNNTNWRVSEDSFSDL